MGKPRILYFDIETAPCLGWAWGIWEQNLIDLKKSWYVLCFAYKWDGEKRIHTKALPDYRGYKKDTECDRALTKDLWKLFDEADIIVAHNGDRFDVKKSNARFAFHGLKPPTPYKTIDTLKIARRNFAFLSNKLNDLGAYLKVGRKLPHTGWSLWRGCMLGDAKSWRLMRRYNARDVELLEKVYQRLRPWHTTHPNLNAYKEKPNPLACPVCESVHTRKGGFNVSKVRKVQRHICQDCGHWFTGKTFEQTKPKTR